LVRPGSATVPRPDQSIVTELQSRGQVFRTAVDPACATNPNKIGPHADGEAAGWTNSRIMVKDGPRRRWGVERVVRSSSVECFGRFPARQLLGSTVDPLPQHRTPGDLLRDLPKTIGSYAVEQRIVAGPSYADYQARHVALGNRVVLRQERWPSQEGAAPGAIEGLRRARRLQAEIRHPHILPIVDFFECNGGWFSVFASAPETQSLAEVIAAINSGQRPPLSLSEFVALSSAVTDALAAVHRAGFVHRTLGSQSVLVDSSSHVMLSDLGCATPLGADDEAARAFRSFMRPASAAPEQFAVNEAFSTATDIWALGVTLFELRYGHHPFWRDAPVTWTGVVAAVLTREIDFPVDDTPEDHLLRSWIRRLLDKNPEGRYRDALEAQRDLLAIAAEMEGRPARAHAFIAMPFSASFEPLWRALKAACMVGRIAVTRVDQSHRNENIWDEVCLAIQSADFTIAVATPETSGIPNPNVMIEIGYARALRKPVLLLTDSADTLPFDLRTQRAMLYKPTSVGNGTFHRDLVSFLGGVVASSVRDAAAE
jgi:hypothetical protein